MPKDSRTAHASVIAAVATLMLLTPGTAHAYIGPGAGFALISSFLVLFTTILLVFVSLLIWPFRMVWRRFRYRGRAKPRIKRLIIVGLDGQEPSITDRMLAEGRLPNMQRLAEQGCYHRIRTTLPALSPVAWSSFATGTNPGKHNIFDFLDRDRRTYLPLLSSTDIDTSVVRTLKLGRLRIPLGKPAIRLLRKSKPFWTVLGEHGIWSTVLRVPITFPPDRFYGAQLSAMAAPDLLGSQGTFLCYTTRPAETRYKEGGIRIQLEQNGDRFETSIQGPENTFKDGSPPLEVPMKIKLDRSANRARVQVNGNTITLAKGELSGWKTISFNAIPGVSVQGLTRFQIIELDDHFTLYLAPVNLSPEKPAMPISHPSYYATYLAKEIGPFATLGLAEDTWALNEEVTDDATFLKQALDIDDERREMFFNALDRLRQGTLVCVFDATDRIQHMFWRYTEPGHPAARGKENAPHKDAIEKLYERNDTMVGDVLARLTEGDVLMVISDHGFSSFRRGVNLNRWLQENGYLALEPGADGTDEWLRHVDWSKTKAYALGLTGVFFNIKGREEHGIVEPGEEARRLKAELKSKIDGLRDEEKGEVAINELYDTAQVYEGPYQSNAPDLIVGYNAGYRASWDCASGVVSTPIFEDNVKAWSGDHSVDPRLVPGVFFCSHKVAQSEPSLIDIAPSALGLFGIDVPAFMEGQDLFQGTDLAKSEAPA